MEKRASRRFSSDLIAECRTPDRSLTVRLRNICTSGCMMTWEDGEIAEKAILRLRVKGLAPIDAEVVWRHRNHAGIRFRVPLHPAALDHLGFELPEVDWANAVSGTRGSVPPTEARRPAASHGLSSGLVKRIAQPGDHGG